MSFQRNPDPVASDERSPSDIFEEDVMRSVILLDSIKHRLSKPDHGADSIMDRSINRQDIITSSTLLASNHTGHGVAPLDFFIILKPAANDQFGFYLGNLFGHPDKHPIVILSILQADASLEGVMEVLPKFRDSIAHEHKHVMDWYRTGDFGMPPIIDHQSNDEELNEYFNNPSELLAWLHGAAVEHFIQKRMECITHPDRLDTLLASSMHELVSPLSKNLNPSLLHALTPESIQVAGSMLSGYVNGVLYPMMQQMKVPMDQRRRGQNASSTMSGM